MFKPVLLNIQQLKCHKLKSFNDTYHARLATQINSLGFKFVSLNNIFGTKWYLKAIINMTIDNIIAAVAF